MQARESGRHLNCRIEEAPKQRAMYSPGGGSGSTGTQWDERGIATSTATQEARMDNLPPIDEIFRQQPYQYYGQNEWTSQYSNSIEDLARMTAFQAANESEARTIEATIEGMPSKRAAAKKQVKSKNVSRRGVSFSQEEDKIIFSAFLNISKDPITGVNQSAGGYYKRIHDYFCKHKSEGSSRTQLAIQHRWQNILKGFNIFCSHKSSVDRRNESGKCEQDRIDDAIKLYEAKEAFAYMHCWKILCKEPKWSDRLLELNRPSPVMNSAPITQASAEIDNETISRPQGRDTAKKRKSCGGDAASSSTAIDMLQQIHERHGKTEEKQDQQMQEIPTMKGDKMKLSEKLFELQKQDMEKRSADMEKRSADMEKRSADMEKRTKLKRSRSV